MFVSLKEEKISNLYTNSLKNVFFFHGLNNNNILTAHTAPSRVNEWVRERENEVYNVFSIVAVGIIIYN